MSGSPLVPLSQRIDGAKDTVIDNVKLIGLQRLAPKPTIKTSAIRFIIASVNAYLCLREDPAAVSLSVYPSPL